MSIGVDSGFAFIAAHDLWHTRDQIDAVLASMLCASIVYMQSAIYHMDRHHVEVGMSMPFI